MNRIKVVNDPSELVSAFRAVDTDVKREVFKEVAAGWRTAQEIEDKFGNEGRLAIRFFNKMKLVETRWQQPPEGTTHKPVKAYHTYYSAFHINTSCSVFEISDVIAAAGMLDKDFKKIEKKILDLIGDEGKFAGDVAEELEVSQTLLKSLVKRSVKFDYRGHRIEPHEDDE
ncbi:MAG: ArsR family transcriptional regulator [Thermoplasmata archaeon]|nr:ArsR family transcriptional regulator [Thermoplasmata archaeon]